MGQGLSKPGQDRTWLWPGFCFIPSYESSSRNFSPSLFFVLGRPLDFLEAPKFY